jgi:exopolysaccharide biosynthesis polyprenyl glycosylphosphotransferase
VAAAVLDWFIVIGSYAWFYHQQFGYTPLPGPSMWFLAASWQLISYVCGRYAPLAQPKLRRHWPKQCLLTMLTLALVLSVYVVLSWIDHSLQQTIRSPSFLLPSLLLTGILSLLGQWILQFAFIQSEPTKARWLVVATNDQLLRLQNLLLPHQRGSKLQLKLFSHSAEIVSKDLSGVLVWDPSQLDRQQQQVLSQLEQQGLPVLPLPLWCEVALERFPPELLTTSDLLWLGFQGNHSGIQSRIKRLGDVGLALFLLVITLPLTLIAALLIWLEDRHAVFYSQERSGFGGEPFMIWKLRSMRVDAEKAGPQWVRQQDQRITRIGALLRRTRLDELPQLWAVVTGDMSLIGPRPERPHFEKELEQQIPHYRLRHSIRPGLSGWAQVNYPYGASVEDAANKLSYDLYYMRNFSIWLDLLVMIKTVRLVFNAGGAVPASASAQPPYAVNQ